MTHPLYIVDVFADRAYAGNPLAVVLDDNYSDQQRRLVAQEMNFSETTFAKTTPENGGHEVHIYTPSQEIAFAGHPILGTAWVLRNVAAKPEAVVHVDLRVGRVTVTFEKEEAWFVAPPIELGPTCEAAPIAHALGLETTDIDASMPIQKLGAGTTAMMVPVKNLDAVKRAKLDLERFHPLAGRGFPSLLYVFSRETHRPENHLCTRFFFVANGVREDPASGNAAAFFGRWALEHGYFRDLSATIRIEQGYELDRPSLVLLRANKPGEISVGGQVFLVAKGELSPPL